MTRIRNSLCIALLMAATVVAKLQFVGEDTPESDFNRMFKSINMERVSSDMKGAGTANYCPFFSFVLSFSLLISSKQKMF